MDFGKVIIEARDALEIDPSNDPESLTGRASGVLRTEEGIYDRSGGFKKVKAY
jgi:hypothetical protein